MPLLDILFPKTCVGCGKEGLYICKDCEVFLSEVPPLSDVSSVWIYEGLMEKLIHKIKYEGCHHIIDELVEMAFQKISLDLPEGAVITFVPMWKKKEKARGFNQAELIARKLGRLLGFAEQPLLKKVRDTKSQTKLDAKERLENVKDSFEFRYPNLEIPQNVALVDDVYTSGATMAECKKALRKAGVRNIWGFTLARTV